MKHGTIERSRQIRMARRIEKETNDGAWLIEQALSKARSKSPQAMEAIVFLWRVIQGGRRKLKGAAPGQTRPVAAPKSMVPDRPRRRGEVSE